MKNNPHPLMNSSQKLSDQAKASFIEAAARSIIIDAKEAVLQLEAIQQLLAKPWEMTAQDHIKLTQAIKLMAKAQANLRKMRDQASSTAAYTTQA